jgi:transposase
MSMAGVMIGIDPHKGSHTAFVIDGRERQLGQVRVRASARQAEVLLQWAARWPARAWAIEGARGLGLLLAQQLIAADQRVVDVPPKLAARVRLLNTGQINKNDENHARSVAITALRAHDLPVLSGQDQTMVMRVCSRRYHDLGRLRTQVICRLHTVLCELVPGGVRKQLRTSQASEVVAGLVADSPVTQAKLELARDLVADLVRIDAQRREARRRHRAGGRRLGDLDHTHRRCRPIVAGIALGYVRDIRRFTSRDHFASYNGTAPIEVSSGNRVIFRLSRRGNRQLNHAIHMAAISQISRRSQGRAYYEKKLAEGMSRKAALRALKRKISDALYARMLDDARRREDPGGHSGNDTASSAAGSHPETPALRKATPGPPPTLKPPPASERCSDPSLLLPGAEPAGAQPGSRWSPARAREAGAGRTDLDAGEHLPTITGAGADHSPPLDNKEGSIWRSHATLDRRRRDYAGSSLIAVPRGPWAGRTTLRKFARAAAIGVRMCHRQ